METLGNDHLKVMLLDPASDVDRLGTRFCWGGFIWQVCDARDRPLLAGPEWPLENPEPFNGQGLPEVLRHSELLTGVPLTHDGQSGIILGVGAASFGSGGPRLTEPATWTITREANARRFRAEQALGDWGATVERSVQVRGTTVTSRTCVKNTGSRPFPLHWFAHPFFPLEDGRVRVGLPGGVAVDENPGFELREGTLDFRRVFVGRDDGHFQELQFPAGMPFSARIGHPVAGFVGMTMDRAADRVYVWANGNTFSIEPYLLMTLDPGGERSWTVTYQFGAGET